MWINNSYQQSWSKNGVVKKNIQGCTDKYRVKMTKSKMEALYIYTITIKQIHRIIDTHLNKGYLFVSTQSRLDLY